jgi:hypothetical protein
MAPTIDKDWESHGWWITEVEPLKPFLSVTIYPFQLAKRTSGLGSRFGEIQAISGRPDDMVYVTVLNPDIARVKFSLSKKLLLAPIPTNLIQNPGQVKLLKSLQTFWVNIHPVVRTARHNNVLACLELSPEMVLRAKRIMNEHIRYEALRGTDPTSAAAQPPPAEPEETEEVFRALARPTQLDWQPVGVSRRREDQHSTPSIQTPLSGNPLIQDERPLKRPRRAQRDIPSSSGGGPLGSDTTGTRLIGRASGLRGRVPRSGRKACGSHRRVFTSMLGGSVNLSNVSQEEQEFYNPGNDPHEDSEEEEEMPMEVRTSHRSKVSVPTADEIAKGSLWGNIVFNVHIDHIVSVENPETNHRVLSQKRARDVYRLLRDPESRTRVSKLVLRPIRYILHTTTDDGEVVQQEVSFPVEGAAREFERLFITHGSASTNGVLGSQYAWLQDRIIWEPVDGQHIVAACKFAQEQWRNDKIPGTEYMEIFQQREATFVVYDDRRFYIDKSVRINVAEWERKSYSTVEEDLRKLRQIWDLYGRPNSSICTDDIRRGIALVSAASAVHRLHKMVDNNEVSIKKLAKNMQDLTRHAWNLSDDCFEAIICICKDYEDGLLFYSKKEEKKWKQYAQKKELDPNVDVRPKRKVMTQNWLRPLSRIPDSYYLQLVQSCTAKPLGTNGQRPCQEYYFNGVDDKNPQRHTIAFAVDRFQREEAVMNIIRWLMVDNKESSPNSMEEFFRISIMKYFPRGKGQVNTLAKHLDTLTKAAWAAPIRGKVSKLENIVNLIPPSIKYHYHNVAAGGRGYNGLSVDVGDLSTANWEWQVQVQRPGQNDPQNSLMVRCRRGFFRSDHVQLGKPCLWVIDCRRGGGRHGDGLWSDEQLSRAFLQLELWMTNIERWNVIFLLPPAIYANEELFTKLNPPEGCSMRHGFWAFDANSVDPYALDFTENGRLQQMVQPIGAVVICMQHPVGTSPSPNYVSRDHPLPLVFQDLWSEAHQPSEVDLLERSPLELSRLVDSYLPRGWGLVACNISTAIPTILLGDFQGSEIIVIDDCTERARFLYDELCNNFQGHMLTTETACGTNSVPDIVQDTEEAIGGEGQDDDNEEEQTLHERLPRSSGSENSLTDNSSTNEESNTDDEEEEEEVDKSPTREGIPSMQPTVEDTFGETLMTPTRRMEDIGVLDVGLVTVGEEANTVASQRLEMEGEASDSLEFFTVQMMIRQPSGPSQSQLESEIHERIEGSGSDTRPILPSVPRSGILEDVAAFQGAFSLDREMSFKDGFYYNDDGIRHTRHGEPGSYRYVESASISLGGTVDRPVHAHELSAMVENAIGHVEGVILP